jgi:gluconolactonase
MMKRILPLSLLVVLSLGAANACKDKSNDNPTDPQQNQNPSDPNGKAPPGSTAPGATEEELNTNPIDGIEPAAVILEAGEFTDGPVWHAGMGVLFFSTPLGEGGLYRMLPAGGVKQVRAGNRAQGQVPIGNTVTAAGDLITVEAKRIVRAAGAGADLAVVATGYGAKPGQPAPAPVGDGGLPPAVDGQFDTLNDVVARKDGTLYVTDPGYFTEPVANRVYRIDPAGKVQVVEAFNDVPRPNGIALSPDEKTLYVGFAAPVAGTLPFIRKYIVNDDGTLGEWTKFKDIGPEKSDPDGLAVDKAGNVYVATKAGIEVYRSNGQPWGTLPVPEKPTGMTFGGEDMKTLFITTEGIKIYQAKLKLAGISQ